MKKLFAIIGILFLLSGCSTVSFIPHETLSARPPKPDNYQVPIISINGPQPSSNHYVIIGTVEVSKDAITVFDKVNLNEVTVMLRDEAKKNGADALINVRQGRGRATGRQVDSVRIVGTAIIFKNPDDSFKQLKEMGAVFK